MVFQVCTKILVECFIPRLKRFSTKNDNNNYFDQPLGCSAPKRWSQYTTLLLQLFICRPVSTIVNLLTSCFYSLQLLIYRPFVTILHLSMTYQVDNQNSLINKQDVLDFWYFAPKNSTGGGGGELCWLCVWGWVGRDGRV